MESFFEPASIHLSPVQTSSPINSMPQNIPLHVQSYQSPSFVPTEFETNPKSYFDSVHYIHSETYGCHPDYRLSLRSTSSLPHLAIGVTSQGPEAYWPSDVDVVLPSSVPGGSFISRSYRHLSTLSTSPDSLYSKNPASLWPIDTYSYQQHGSAVTEEGSFDYGSPSSPQSSHSPASAQALEDNFPLPSSLDSCSATSGNQTTGDSVVFSAEPSAFYYSEKSETCQELDEDISREHGSPVSSSPTIDIQVMHTDDAISKETQYLRRRCFNCHTTEPPSWRRSTLNPGKIVCNKCGLYERTHLRPRPHRFDELRGGPKTRKTSAKAASSRAFLPSRTRIACKDNHEMSRNTSMTSLSSGNSEREDRVVYNQSSTLSPPMTNSNISQLGAYQTSSIASKSTHRGQPKKTRSVLSSWTTPYPPSIARQQGYLPRQGSADVSLGQLYRRQLPMETGWQTIPLQHVRGATESTLESRVSVT